MSVTLVIIVVIHYYSQNSVFSCCYTELITVWYDSLARSLLTTQSLLTTLQQRVLFSVLPMSWGWNIAVSFSFHCYSKWIWCIRSNPGKKNTYQTSAALLKNTFHSVSLSAASDVPWYRDILCSGCLPQSVTQHLPLRIKVRTLRYRKMPSVVRCKLPSWVLTRHAASQGRRRHSGFRRHQTNWTPGGAWNTWLWKTIGHLETFWLLPLWFVRLA